MKCASTLVLVLLTCVPANAQFGGMGGMAGARPPASQAGDIEYELLMLEQEADKELLREALLAQGRMALKARPDTQVEKREIAAQAARVEEFIDAKKKAIITRAAELAERRLAGRKVPAQMRANPSADADRHARIEKYEKAKVEAQLIEAQLGLLQKPLADSIQAVAEAELAASNDESLRPKAEAARKEFERTKAKTIELNTRLQIEQQTMQMMGMARPGGMM